MKMKYKNEYVLFIEWESGKADTHSAWKWCIWGEMNVERHFIKCLKCKRFTSMGIVFFCNCFFLSFSFFLLLSSTRRLDSYTEIKEKSHFIFCTKIRQNKQTGVKSIRHLFTRWNQLKHPYILSGNRQHPSGWREQFFLLNKFMHINSIVVLDKNEFCLHVCVGFSRFGIYIIDIYYIYLEEYDGVLAHWHRQISTSSQTMNVIIASVMFTQQELGVNYCYLWNLFVKIASNNL